MHAAVTTTVLFGTLPALPGISLSKGHINNELIKKCLQILPDYKRHSKNQKIQTHKN